MDNVENKPQETTAPAAAPATDAASAPVPVESLASSVPETGTPKANPSTGGLGAGAPAPVEIVKGIVPTTKGNVPGGWNRFAGYKPGEAKNKQKDRRDDRRGRR